MKTFFLMAILFSFALTSNAQQAINIINNTECRFLITLQLDDPANTTNGGCNVTQNMIVQIDAEQNFFSNSNNYGFGGYEFHHAEVATSGYTGCAGNAIFSVGNSSGTCDGGCGYSNCNLSYSNNGINCDDVTVPNNPCARCGLSSISATWSIDCMQDMATLTLN